MTWTSSCLGVWTAMPDKICPMEVSTTDLCMCVAQSSQWWSHQRKQAEQQELNPEENMVHISVFSHFSDSFPLNGTINIILNSSTVRKCWRKEQRSKFYIILTYWVWVTCGWNKKCAKNTGLEKVIRSCAFVAEENTTPATTCSSTESKGYLTSWYYHTVLGIYFCTGVFGFELR